MKLYLHIGLHKTGSTYLQRFFYQNYENLTRAGFLFPRTGFLNLNTIGGGEQTSAGHDLFVKASLSRRQRFTANLLNSFYEEIKITQPQAVFVSAENFTNHQIGDLSKNTLNLFCNYFDDIRIIISLRNIYDWIDSYYRDRVASGWEFEKYDIYSFIKKNNISSYPSFHLKNWSNCFGKSQIDVVILGKELQEKGILDFYCDYFGLNRNYFTFNSDFKNESPSNEFVKTVLHFNRKVLPGSAARKSIVQTKKMWGGKGQKSSLLTHSCIEYIDAHMDANDKFFAAMSPVVGCLDEIFVKPSIANDREVEFNAVLYDKLCQIYTHEACGFLAKFKGLLLIVYSYLPLKLRMCIKRFIVAYKY